MAKELTDQGKLLKKNLNISEDVLRYIDTFQHVCDPAKIEKISKTGLVNVLVAANKYLGFYSIQDFVNKFQEMIQDHMYYEGERENLQDYIISITTDDSNRFKNINYFEYLEDGEVEDILSRFDKQELCVLITALEDAIELLVIKDEETRKKLVEELINKRINTLLLQHSKNFYG